MVNPKPTKPTKPTKLMPAKPKPSPRARSAPVRPRNQRLRAPEIVKVLLTVEEAAARLSIGRTVCYRLIRRGDLQSILVGSSRRVPVEAVTLFVERALARSSA